MQQAVTGCNWLHHVLIKCSKQQQNNRDQQAHPASAPSKRTQLSAGTFLAPEHSAGTLLAPKHPAGTLLATEHPAGTLLAPEHIVGLLAGWLASWLAGWLAGSANLIVSGSLHEHV